MYNLISIALNLRLVTVRNRLASLSRKVERKSVHRLYHLDSMIYGIDFISFVNRAHSIEEVSEISIKELLKAATMKTTSKKPNL